MSRTRRDVQIRGIAAVAPVSESAARQSARRVFAALGLRPAVRPQDFAGLSIDATTGGACRRLRTSCRPMSGVPSKLTSGRGQGVVLKRQAI